MNFKQLVILLIIGTVISTANSDPNYQQDLEDAATLFRSTIKTSSDGSDFKQKLFKYVTNSELGRKYFLHALLMSHQILNEPQVKEVLDFLLENGVDIMKVFSINVPSTLWDKLKGKEEDTETADSSEDNEKNSGDFGTKLGTLPFQDMLKFIDTPELVRVMVSLLQENAGFQKVWEFLSRPDLHREVGGVIAKSEYKDFLTFLGGMFGDLSDLSLSDMGYGVMKVFNVQGDKRSMTPEDRLLEGLRIVGSCGGDEETELCETIDKLKSLKKSKKSEL